MSCAWLFCAFGMSQTDRHSKRSRNSPPEFTEWSDRFCNRRNLLRQQCSSCSFFCIYIDVELFAFQALCFCIFLNSCLKVGNCDGCLKNFKCDAADLMIFYSVLNFFYYFWCLGCYSLCCLFDCFNGFSAAGVFQSFLQLISR